MGNHECILHFIDEKVGEFLYRIEGRAHNPDSIEKFIWPCTSGGVIDKSIRLSPLNSLREKAIYYLLSLRHNIVAGQVSHSNPIQRSKDIKLSSATVIEREAYQLPKRPLKYRVEYFSPYFRGPNEIIVKPPTDTRDKSLTLNQTHTDLPISFFPRV